MSNKPIERISAHFVKAAPECLSPKYLLKYV